MTYLDHNASAPLCEAAREAMRSELAATPGNPSSIHRHGRRQRALIENQRRKLAALIGGRASEITFTSGATAAIHLGLNSLVSSGQHVLCSRVEHPAVVGALEWIGADIEWIPVDAEGRCRVEDFIERLRSDTAACILMAAHNELGNVYPVRELVEAVAPIPVFSDSVQALGRIELNAQELGVAGMAFSAHKLGGPKGVGALWLKAGVHPKPVQVGGGQEQGRQGGTENVIGIAGFGGALDALPERLLDQDRQRLLRDALENRLKKSNPRVVIHGDLKNRLANTSHFRIEGVAGEILLQALDLEGVSVSSGSACSSGALEPSPTLLAMGLEKNSAKAGLRISMGPETASADIDRFLHVLTEVVMRIEGER